ncbi:MAG: hypothetical protein ACLFUB_00205 [Cyclobacteriaceae bacterium]
MFRKVIFYFCITLPVFLLLPSPGASAQDLSALRPPKFAPDTTIKPNPGLKINETPIKYSRSLLNQDFDFELKSVAHGKFKVNILNDTKAKVSIRVYDVIGNLLYEENVRIRGSFMKEFDLSQLKTNFFIVEIGNNTFNKTKSIVAV